VASRVRVGPETVEGTMRATFVLVREGDSWAIVHAHFSVAPAAPVAGY
jgi:ketosteroid isomerase-like protein